VQFMTQVHTRLFRSDDTVGDGQRIARIHSSPPTRRWCRPVAAFFSTDDDVQPSSQRSPPSRQPEAPEPMTERHKAGNC
jgi:hypothetical protein